MSNPDSASEEVARMVHAFGDEGRRQAVRALALRVAGLEAGNQQQTVLIRFHADAFDRARAETEALRGRYARTMQALLSYMSAGDFDRAWKLADYECRALRMQPAQHDREENR